MAEREQTAETVTDSTERERIEAALRESETRFRTVIEQSPLSLQICSPDGRTLQVNRAWEELWGVTLDQIPEYNILRDPQLAEKGILPYIQRGFAGEATVIPPIQYDPNETLPGRTRHADPRRWVQAYIYPVKDEAGTIREVVLMHQDVTEQKQAEQALQYQNHITQVITDNATACLFMMDANGRCTFMNPAAEQVTGYTFAEVKGRTLHDVIHHTHPDGTPYPLSECPIDRALPQNNQMRAHEDVFIRKDGTFFPVLCAASPIIEDGVPVGTVIEVRDITEEKRVEEERARLLAEAQAQAEREALVNRIGQAQLASDSPEVVQAVAMEALGQALGADRCYFVSFDIAQDRAWVGQDWHRADLPSLAGEYRLSDFQINIEDLYRSGEARITEDVRTHPATAALAPTFEAMGLRSSLGVPIFENGRLVAVLSAAMADTPRAWTEEEVALVQAVAAQTRSTTKAASLLQRQKTIAEHLQRALTPELPGQVPGLDIAFHYQPALAEASVGGDFFDVFAVEKGCIALIIGDLSGKGLNAASQVATVRNMLRYALYRGRTTAEALAELNETLVEHNLLTGFVTLFAGLYDTGAGTLTYVSCGHEPGLLRHAGTGEVEELTTTGPVVGIFDQAHYEARDVTLRAGDTLALYTDGLSEAGRERHEFLGVEGLADLLRGDTDGEPATRVVERIMASVEAHARGSLHDDVCLLVATVQRKG